MHSLLPQLNLGAAPLQKGTASLPAETPEGAAPRQIDASFEEVMLADAGPSHLDDASQPDTPLTDQAQEEAAPKQQSPDAISDDVDVAQTVDDQSSPGASRHVSKAEPTNFPAFPQENASSFKEEKLGNGPILSQRMSTIAVDSPDQSVNDRPAAETGVMRHPTTELARAELGVSATTTPERGPIPSPPDTMDASPPMPGRAKPGKLPSQSVEQAVGPSPPRASATTQREGTVPAHANALPGLYDKLAGATTLDADAHRIPTPGVRPSSNRDPLKAPDAPALSSGFEDRTITVKDVQTRVAEPLPELKKTPVTPVPSRDPTLANRPVSEAISLVASPAPHTDRPARAGQT
ncbi:MAG: hypothetical protein P1U53_13480, partial [Sulfitobacter sp.]|nr:hypothetical protein [Sulfitobacter sp.]